MLAQRVCRRDPLPRRVERICGRGPRLAMGEESAPRRGAQRILGRRACVRRAWVYRARHAERRKRDKPEGSRSVQQPFLMAKVAKASPETLTVIPTQQGSTTKKAETTEAYRSIHLLALSMVLRM